MIGAELMKRMQEQIRLEDIYNVSIQKADGAFMAAMDNDDVRETLERLQKNTRELCRKMKDKPTIVADLRNFQETRPANVVQLLRTLADMQDVTLKRLTTTVEEENSRKELLQLYLEREQAASARRPPRSGPSRSPSSRLTCTTSRRTRRPNRTTSSGITRSAWRSTSRSTKRSRQSTPGPPTRKILRARFPNSSRNTRS